MSLTRKCNLKPFFTLLRFNSGKRKTHYDVLNLRSNCSEKEIKEAFISLSKTYHPDKNKNVQAQEHFVQIVEAYNVLSKPGSRAQYDSSIKSYSTPGSSYVYKTHVPYNLRHRPQYNYHYNFYNSQGNSSSRKPGSDTIFGFKVRRVPNFVIITVCAAVALFGAIVQMFVVRNMYVTQRKQAQEKSMRLAEDLEKVRAAANANGNELQTRLLLDKIVSAANPTVATASMGQALANEKKHTSGDLMGDLLSGIAQNNEDWSFSNEEPKVFNTNIFKIMMFR